MHFKLNRKRFPLVVLFTCIAFQLIYFVFAPKQAYMQGLLESWYASRGLIFYKDATNAYLPFLKFVMWGFHSVFGYSLVLSAVLSPLLSIAITLSLYHLTLARKADSIYRVAPIIFFTLWNSYLGGNMFSVTSFLGLLLLFTYALWSMWWNKPKSITAFLFGTFSSISVLTLQIVAPFVAFLGLAFIARAIRRERTQLFPYLVGGTMPVALVLIWVYRAGIVTEFFYWNFWYYFGGYPYASLGKDTTTILVYIAVHVPLVLYALSKKHLLGAVSLLVLMSTFWFAVFHPMRFQISLPLIALVYGRALESRGKGKLKNFVAGGTIALSGLVFVFYAVPYYKTALSVKNTDKLVSEVYKGDPMYDAVAWVKVNTPPDARIFVLADTYFYLAAKRLPVNHRSALGVEPIFFYPIPVFTQEIHRRPPDYWIIDERLFISYSNWGSDDVSAAMKAFLQCQSVTATFDYWKIYKTTDPSFSCSGL